MIPIFASFSVLPSFLYWAIPLTLIGACVWYHRPRPLALAVIAILVVWPEGLGMLAYFGSPTIWVVAALAVATTRHEWAGPFVLLKPSVFPFAAWGIRSKRWWLGLAAFIAVSAVFAGFWLDYLRALLNARVESGPLYSLPNVSALLIPIVARLGARTVSARY
jgi:hypothetical protein